MSKGLGLGQVKAFFAGVGDADGVVVRLQAFLQSLGHLQFVLDHKDVHVPFIEANAGLTATDEILTFS